MVPEIASGVPVRWADVASPWIATIGGDPRGTRYEASIVARVALRYDDEKADLVHDEEYEAVLFPLADPVDAAGRSPSTTTTVIFVPTPPDRVRYTLPGAGEGQDVLAQLERDLVDNLVRSRTVEMPVNRTLKLTVVPVRRPSRSPPAATRRPTPRPTRTGRAQGQIRDQGQAAAVPDRHGRGTGRRARGRGPQPSAGRGRLHRRQPAGGVPGRTALGPVDGHRPRRGHQQARATSASGAASTPPTTSSPPSTTTSTTSRPTSPPTSRRSTGSGRRRRPRSTPSPCPSRSPTCRSALSLVWIPVDASA